MTSTNDNEYIELFPYILDDNMLYRYDDSAKQEKFVSYATKVKNVLRNLETGKIELELKYWSFDGWQTLKVNRGKLVKTELGDLMDKGLDISGNKYKYVFAFIDLHEKNHTPKYFHDKLGWAVFKDDLVYKHQIVLSPMGNFSSYKGKFEIHPLGDLKKWLKVIRTDVVGHTPLELMLSAGLSAVLVGMLNVSKKADIDSLIFHLAGNSTTGKTTGVMVAVSAFGSPSMKNGLLQSYNGTKNAMIGMLAGNYGVPIVFDESSMNRMGTKSLSSLLYEIAQNMERARMDKEANIREINTWATSVFSTGEHTIIGKSNANEGIRARVYEFMNVEWTKDAASSDRLKEVLMNNYGHAAQYFVRHIQAVGLDEVVKQWEENKKYIFEKMPPSKFRDRVGNKFALVLTAASYANEALKLKLSIEKIADMLVEQEEKSMNERELAPKFYEKLKEKLIQYKRNFKIKGIDDSNTSHETWGKIELKTNKTICFILPTIFDRLVEELGFSDSSILLDELKNLEVLNREKNKTTIRKAIFTKNELSQREKVLGEKAYAPKGDPTISIIYYENIYKEFNNIDMNNTKRKYGFNEEEAVVVNINQNEIDLEQEKTLEEL